MLTFVDPNFVIRGPSAWKHLFRVHVTLSDAELFITHFITLVILGETVTPVVSMLAQEGPITGESLAEDTKKVLEEITR